MFYSRIVATGLACLFYIQSIKHSSSFLTATSFRGVQGRILNFAFSTRRPLCPTMSLEPIKVTKNPSEDEIKALGARNWPTWGCGVSKFPWLYEGTETCLILEGDFTVTPDDDREPATVGPGDLCVFPNGMSCTWDVRAPVRKHYRFD